MSEQTDIQAALNAAYYFLKFRPRTKKEVERNLKKKAAKYSWSDTVIEKTVKELEEQNMINDRDFISWFVDQRSRAKPKSQFALRSELLKLGISKDVLDEHFTEHETDDETLAYEALKRRWPRFQYLDTRTRFQKSAAFLSSRGFSFEMIRKAVQKLEDAIS